MLRRRLLATATIIAMSSGLAATASAATQEYQFTVPVSIKIAPKSVKPDSLASVGSGAGAGKAGGLPVTVTCAVGPASLALAGGQAVNASGSGSATAQLQRGAGSGVFSGNVAVTITAADASKPANTYLCWTVVSSTVLAAAVQTPVNFITGKVAPGTASAGTGAAAPSNWDLVTNNKGG
jgi:hypothetical protein